MQARGSQDDIWESLGLFADITLVLMGSPKLDVRAGAALTVAVIGGGIQQFRKRVSPSVRLDPCAHCLVLGTRKALSLLAVVISVLACQQDLLVVECFGRLLGDNFHKNQPSFLLQAARSEQHASDMQALNHQLVQHQQQAQGLLAGIHALQVGHLQYSTPQLWKLHVWCLLYMLLMHLLQ